MVERRVASTLLTVAILPILPFLPSRVINNLGVSPMPSEGVSSSTPSSGTNQKRDSCQSAVPRRRKRTVEFRLVVLGLNG